MNIRFSKKFTKSYGKLSEKDKNAVDVAISKFMNDPYDKSLRNHALKGKRKVLKIRSIDASPDLRILFTETKKYSLVIMVEVGSHSQLYG